MQEIIDVISKADPPFDALSNFYPNGFVLDGVKCASMEGFLQSLKTRSVKNQEKVCLLSGKTAKRYFERKINNLWWKITGNLYWRGKKIKRCSDEYQRLLDRAYEAMSEAPDLIKALKATGNATLIHTIGKCDCRKTVLTEYEFVSRLERIRSNLQ